MSEFAPGMVTGISSTRFAFACITGNVERRLIYKVDCAAGAFKLARRLMHAKCDMGNLSSSPYRIQVAQSRPSGWARQEDRHAALRALQK